MKSFIFVIVTMLFISCVTSRDYKEVNKNNCNENVCFKEIFFKHINNVENQILTQDTDDFDISLRFISKYTHVSFESMANYSNIYPLGVFEKDKNDWLKWYDENKCNNIQFIR